jgi:histidinol-phosphate aminotransferase
LDEAYWPFAASGRQAPPRPNLVRVQSPGKAHGVLGMRLAYALADPALAPHLANFQPAWAFPTAQAAALAAIPGQQDFLDEALPTMRQPAHDLALALGAPPTGLDFFTIRVPEATAVAALLLSQGLRVRDCTSFGYPDRIRILTRRPQDNQQQAAAWRQLSG